MSGIAETFDFTPHEITLCRQIGRGLQARLAASPVAADRLTFCEPEDSARHHIYARSMPEWTMRRTPAISIVPVAAPLGTGEEHPLRALGFEMMVRGPSMARVMAILNAARAWLLTLNQSIVLPRSATTHYGQKTGAILGIPPALAASPALGASEDLWAIVRTEAITNIIAYADGDPGVSTAEGEAEAGMSMAVYAYPVRMRGAREALLAMYAPAGGLVELNRGTIEVTTTHVILTSNAPVGTTTIPLAAPPTTTIGDVRAAIDAVAGWSTEDGDHVDDAQPATSLLEMSETTAYDGPGDGPVSLARALATAEMDSSLV